MHRMVQAFQRGLRTAAVWSSTDAKGNPLDKKYTAADFSEEASFWLDQMVIAFLGSEHETLTRLCDHDEHAWECAGHDTWLTANGHGAGFLDGRWPHTSVKRLADAARKLGPLDLLPRRRLIEVYGGKLAPAELKVEFERWLGRGSSPDLAMVRRIEHRGGSR